MGVLKGRGSLIWAVCAALFLVTFPTTASYASHSGFDPNNLISDGEFIDLDSMSVGEIQRFLVEQRSFLKDFSENGRSASQIIWDASHGYGEASGTINGISITSATGTVSPKVILVTLQKEQSLISRTSRDDNALSKAMGYACPDDGSCNPAYAGFTKQVENGAWQLRFNYERAKERGFSDFQVGQTQCFSDVNGTNCATFSNRATAALYRYTPHVYNGNHNFHNLYVNTYNLQADEYQASPVEWSSSDGAYVYPKLVPGGEGTNLVIKVRNNGRASWTRGTVNLGTARGRDRIAAFERESGIGAASGWISANRVKMQETSVAPGQTATFSFWIRALPDKQPGTYREYFELVADGTTWFRKELGIYWDIKVLTREEQYEATPVEWSSSSGSYVYPTISRGGQGTNLVIKARNTGKVTWRQGEVNLGTARPRDRVPGFLRESNTGAVSGWTSANRIKMQETSVAPGGTATFSFWIAALPDKPPGTYREYFELVADGVTWFPERSIYWDVTVR